MKKCLISVFILLIACSKEAPIDDEPVRVPTYTLTVNSGEGGTVDSTGGTYNQGQTVSVRAIPNPGYEFTGWSGDASGTSNPLSVTIDSNTSITAQFTRIKYLLGVNISGDGNVTQEVISAGKTPTEYNSGTVVRLESIPSDGWLFHTWSGASTDTGNIIDITIDGTKTVTASFEEIIAIVLDPDGISARGVGKWKIKKRTSLSGASKDVSSQEKNLNDPCEIYEVIFRSDGTFTMVSAVGTNSGNYVYIDDSTIYLTKQGQEYARYENVVLTESVMSFTLILGDCDYSYKTEKDETYDEASDPITGTITNTTECSITGGLSSGPISQIVTATFNVDTVAFEFSTTCTEAFTITTTGLPPGITVTDIFDECCVNIQGTTTEAASGTYEYSITASNSFTSFTVTGSIEVVQGTTESCTSAALSVIDGQLNQTITIGDAITQTRLQLDTDCPDDENNVPLNSISSGLPSGVIYSFDGENNQVIISGTPEFTGVFNYSITYFNNDTIDSSTVTASIGGTFTVSSSQATTTSGEDCTINASLVSGSFNQTASPGETINLVVRITSDCATITNSSMVYNPGDSSGVNPGADGLPPGLTFSSTEYQNGELTVTVNGTLSNQASGTYTWGLVYDNSYSLPPTPQDASPIQAATTSITIQSVFTVVASSTTSSSTNPTTNNCQSSLSNDLSLLSVTSTLSKNQDGTGLLEIEDFKITFVSPKGSVHSGAFIGSSIAVDTSCSNNQVLYDIQGPFRLISGGPGSNGFDGLISGEQYYTIQEISNAYEQIYLSQFNNGAQWSCSSSTNCQLMKIGRIDVYQRGYDNSGIYINFNRDYAALFKCSQNPQNNDDSNFVRYSLDPNGCGYINTDTTQPVITINGSSTVQLNVGDSWTDPGATATDDTDGDITSSITVNGTVDTSTVGTYTLIYSVADAASNAASTTRTVVVNPAATSSIYFENGTCKCPNATVGETATISGITYTVVDNSTIQGEVDSGNVNLCTTLVTNMTDVFKDKSSFNSDISFWDTSNVTLMNSMFANATNFNQDISNWDVSSVTDMAYLFYVATAFNQNIDNWDVSNVTNMYYLFAGAENFNQPLISWNVSNVTNMYNLFHNAFEFNQDIGSWDVSNVTDMGAMFHQASSFNQDIGGWDVSSVTNMSRMFFNASTFNKNLNQWNVSSCSDFQFMFDGAISFNSDISSWDTSNATSFASMFQSSIFNQNIGNWNVSNVTDMRRMFRGNREFNQNISDWDVSNVNNMNEMFKNTVEFNQDISNWCVTNLTEEPNDFSTGSALINQNKPVWGTCPSSNTDTTPPVITLNGSSTIQLNVGDTWTDPGATANDETDGDITSSITVNGTVDTSSVGTYTLTYWIADAASNSASTTRVVIIVDSNAGKTYVPDTFFEQGLIDNGLDDILDDYVLTENINSISSLTISGRNISSLEGIQDFVSLVSLNASSNNITTLDLTSLVNLDELILVNNNLTSINLSGNVNLTRLRLNNNQLSSLDVSNNTLLQSIEAANNLLTSIDISNNTRLGVDQDWDGKMADLTLSGNQLTTVDLSNNNNLYRVFLNDNPNLSTINGLNSQAFNSLVRVDIQNTTVSSLDINSVPNLEILNISGTSISSIDVSGAQLMYSFNSTNNPSLECININTSQRNNIPNGWSKDSGAAYSTNCSGGKNAQVTVNVGAGGNLEVQSRIWNTTSSFSDTQNGGSVGTNSTFYEGEKIILTATPFESHKFNRWNHQDNSYDSNSNPETYFLGTSDFIINLLFTKFYTINVSASSSTDYILNGSDLDGEINGNDPTITINRGEELNFIVNSPGHPFYIKSAQGTGTENLVDGVTNNGTTDGTVTWTPTAPGTYYYQCSLHNDMYGVITVQ